MASASALIPPWTPSRRPGCRPGAGCSRAGRMRCSTRRARPSGCPTGQMGNSEVGHLNIGAGRPVLQDLPRIDAAIADGSFFQNEALLGAARRAAAGGRRLHLVSLVGPGGVHANDRHLVAVAELARRAGVEDVVVHALLDGRDTPPRSAGPFLADLEARLAGAHPGARIATIGGPLLRHGPRQALGARRRHSGRRWSRVRARSPRTPRPVSPRRTPGARTTSSCCRPSSATPAPVRDGDVVIHCNFRADRARELTHALVDGDGFAGFDRGAAPARPACRHPQRVRGGPAGRGRLPARRRDQPRRDRVRRRAGDRRTSPRPRSTPT